MFEEDQYIDGKYVFAKGHQKYEGKFKNGQKHGSGSWQLENGDSYEG